MSNHVVLLRGVNVGGKNKLPMADLRAALTDAGYDDVSTYIQSGNIALTADSVDRVAISELIEATFGLTIPVVVRTLAQLNATVANNPFPAMAAQPKFLHVYFCEAPIDADAVDGLDLERFRPDQLALGPGPAPTEVYVSYPNGVARSKLTNAVLDRALGQVTTARNWNTVRKLVEMAKRSAGAVS